jgi:putative transposase
VNLRSAHIETKENEVAAADIVPVPGARFEETLAAASPDVMREMIKEFAQRMMDADVEVRCNAGYGEVTPGAGELPQRLPAAGVGHPGPARWSWAIPRLREGSASPRSWSTGAGPSGRWPAWWPPSYLLGVSTRRVEKLAAALGVTGLSKSQVSLMAAELDQMVEGFRSRPLDAGPYTFVWVDALTQKVREGGRTVNVHALIATAVNADGRRGILGIEVASSEDGAGWLAFLRGLVARGLSGVQLVTSDCHQGLRDAIASVLPGAAWQRCRTHYHRNLLTRVPKSAQPWLSTLVRTIFEQPDAASVRRPARPGRHRPGGQVPAGRRPPGRGPRRHPGVHRLPREVWRQIWSNNPQERLNKEIRRRTDVVGIFPGRDAIIRLVGTVLAEQNDEWTEACRYMGPEILAACQKAAQNPGAESETGVTIEAIGA